MLFLTLLLVARQVGPSQFAAFSVAAAIAEMSRQIAQQGVAQMIVASSVASRAEVDTGLIVTIIYSCAISVVLISISWPLEAILSLPELGDFLIWMPVYVVVVSIGSIPEALLMRELAFRAIAVRGLVSAIAGAAVALAFLHFDLPKYALLGQLLAQASVASAAMFVSARYLPRLKISRDHFLGYLSSGWRFASIEFLTAFTAYADQLLLALFLTPSALGVYGLAVRLINTITDLFVGMTSVIALPIFAKMKSDTQRMADALARAACATLLVAAPAFTFIAVLAGDLIPAILGQEWRNAIATITILSFAGMLSAVTFFHRAVYISLDRIDIEMWVMVTLAAVTVVLTFALGPFGLQAAAWAMLLRRVIAIPVRLIAVRSVLPIRAKSVLLEWGRLAAAAAMAGILLFTLTRLLSPALAWQFAAAIAAGVSYLGILILANNQTVRYVRSIVSSR